MPDIYPVILSGGSGTRLWPASRSMYPKQLLPLTGEHTMLQQTAMRLRNMSGAATRCMVVCNEVHRYLIAEQLREVNVAGDLVLEPVGRNTAPAVALAALLMAESDPDAVMLVMPADHQIDNVEAFHAAVANGLEAAKEYKLVVFGILPTAPETGFGYIEAQAHRDTAVPVRSFVEKPDLETAREYLAGGRHFWNSGILLFSAQTYLDELSRFAPEILDACTRSVESKDISGEFTRPGADEFAACPSDSIDFAVMEKTEHAVMVPLDAGWSDVGSWSELHKVREKDADGNTAEGDVLIMDCRDTLVHAESRLVAAVGLEGMVIIETGDSMLVATRDRAQDVKTIVDKLAETGRHETEHHQKVHRPWGTYDSLDNGDGFQFKRLIVKPGAILSLQKHAHRAEHWVVVQGTARITRNDEEFDLAVNESTYIAPGDVHRIANPFDEPVHIIEVQCGDYLGEDDIVRIDDSYGREGTNT